MDTRDLNAETVQKLKLIQLLVNEAESIFSGISRDEQNRILEFHNETGSINHCLRWGRTALDEIVGEGGYHDPAVAPACRQQAMKFLEQAQSLDDLQPWAITHTHNYGSSTYIGWLQHEPSEQEACRVLDSKYEPDRGESLDIGSELTLSELTGVSETSHMTQKIAPSTSKPRMRG
mgnify:CR=1 FL=1